jgi:SAM-dependent methyltransferase
MVQHFTTGAAEPLSRLCNLCGSGEAFRIGTRQINGVRTADGEMDFTVSIACCSSCGLVFQDPPQEQARLEAYYAAMFREERSRPAEWKQAEFLARHQFGAQFVDSLPDRSVLEVGCADGTTLAGFEALGLSPHGIEPSAQNTVACRERGVEVFEGPYEAYPAGRRQFGLVSSYYVMEHLLSPAHFLQFCNRQLLPDGVLLIEIPDIEAYANEDTAGDLVFFFEHQTHFTRETVTRLLEKCGFELLAFAPEATHQFGMHFAARKVGEPADSLPVEPPAGAAEKVLSALQRYQEVADGRLRALRESVAVHFPDQQVRKVVVFGASVYGRMVLRLPETPRSMIAFVADNSPQKWGTEIEGIRVEPPTSIDSTVDLILVASTFYPEIRAQLLGMGIEGDRIVPL